jgi:hypothetical protein
MSDLSRRQFLRNLGVVAGAGVVGRVVPRPQALRVSTGTGHRLSDDVVRGPLAPVAAVQHFNSRPDLQPPVIAMQIRKAARLPGYVFLDCHGTNGQKGPMILDNNGDLVWFNPVSTGPPATDVVLNVRPGVYKGQPVLTYFEGAITQGHGSGLYKIVGPNYELITEVHAANNLSGDLHEFLITPQGTALLTAYLETAGNLSSVGGSPNGKYWCGVAQEVDIATGALVFQWRSDQHVAFSESYTAPSTNLNVPWDYFHINSINVDPVDNNLVISGRHTSAAYKVNRTSGAPIWRLGGKKSRFTIEPGAGFSFQHHVVPYPGGLFSVFNNADGPPYQATQSSAMILQLDQSTAPGVVKLSQQYFHSPGILSQSMGSCQLLSGNHRFVGWGDQPYFTEFDSQGDVLMQGQIEGALSYRAFKGDWTGAPGLSHPAVAVSGTDVYASWNGATQVATWRVLGGSTSTSLSPITSLAKKGFETKIPLTSTPAYVSVQALSSTGSTLGQSGVIAT